MAFTDNNNGVPSLQEPLPDDDLSLILRHLLRRPPPSSSPAPATLFLPPAISGDDQLFACPSSSSAPSRSAIAVFSASDRLSAGRVADENENSLNGVVLSSSTPMNNPTYFPVSGGSSDSLTGSVQMTGFEHDDYDGESEEAAERTAAEEGETKQPPSRSQSKRSRAAEVHNLSEKRRRSRINEKMKALQNLIPNSNKTDKASMLDEAIEYLKQLQLQVQMLSIRNGLSLHPMCLPGVAGIVHPTQISQVGMDLGGHRPGKSRDVNTRSAINMTSNTADTMFNLPKQSALPATASVSTAINSQAPSFGLGSCILPDFGSFELRDQSLHEDHFFANNTETRTPVTRVPLLPENQESNVTRYNPSKGLTSR